MNKKITVYKKKPLIAYPGSTIQQNYGEALEHGILLWDVNTKTSKFINIQNDYGYVTIEVDAATIINAPSYIPNKPRIRIKFNNTSAADIKTLITNLRKKYDVQDITVQRSTTQTNSDEINQIAIGNVRDVEYQNELITEFVSTNYPDVSAEEQDAIRYINRTINSKLPAVESVRHMTWHPISFEFSNMFSYGEDNIINFENMQDVCGLFASNTAGKSSLLDAITYTIFDKCSKTGKAHEVLNNKKTSFTAKFKFDLNGTTYTIERNGIKQKNGHVKVLVNFYTDTENLNGEERSETNKNIRRYLGTYDDFILTAFSLQVDNNNFIEKSQRERKDLLSQFLDITVFEQLYQLATDEIKETAGRLKEYKKTDFASIISESDHIINNNHDNIKRLEAEELDLQESRSKIQDSILELVESKLPTTYDGPSLTELENQENNLTKKIDLLQKQIAKSELELDDLTNEISELTTNIKSYNKNQLDSNVAQHQLIQTKLQQINGLIQTQQDKIHEKQRKIQHLDAHQYDPKCEYCTSNVFVQDAIQAQSTIEADQQVLTELNTTRDELQTELLIYEPSVQDKIHVDNLIKLVESRQITHDRNDLQLQVLENELQTRESELETCLERQELFKHNETAITHNAKINKTIESYKREITIIAEKIKQITSNIRNMYGEVEVAKTTKQSAIDQLTIYKQLEIESKAYEYYLLAVKRDGIPYELISKALPKIESEINNVLNQVVDFNMVLQTDGKNINGYIIYDESNFWPLELTSGMERFISSLAIRIALINISALPRPNFIAIDEGWGSLDAEHISSVVNLFEYFKHKFDFSIIISHVDSMRDMVNSLISIDKVDGFSKIHYT
jgi:DNA repair exonuclease SbcCD ATPase subunit